MASASLRKSIKVRRTLALATVFALVGVGALRLWPAESDPVLGKAKAPILLAWTSPDHREQLATAARSIDGIGEVAEARNGMGWLTSWGPTGGPESSAPEDFMVPVEILAVDPADYSTFLPDSHRPLFAALEQGGALLGATGASLRGIESEGTLTLPETTIPVLGVVPDVLVASHEVVVSNQTAVELGITEPRYLLLELKRGTNAQEAEQELARRLPEGTRLGVRATGEGPVFRPGGSLLPQAEVKELFGEFAARPTAGRAIRVDPAWILENTSRFTIPLLGPARCHNKIIPTIKAAFEEIVERDLAHLVHPNDFGGCFSPRFLDADPHSGMSRHSWGMAFDFNVSANPYGAKPKMDPRLVELMEQFGFTWGGYWVVPDGMHFEYLTAPGQT